MPQKNTIMSGSSAPRPPRRVTMPIVKSDSDKIFDSFFQDQKLKTLPVCGPLATSYQRVTEVDTFVTDKPQLKRSDSYRQAAGRESWYDHLDETIVLSGVNSVKKERHKTLPQNFGSTKDLPKELAISDKKESVKYQRQRSGSLPSPDTDDDQLIIAAERKKKSAFQRVKERLLLTLSRDKDQSKMKKRKPKTKKDKTKTKKKSHAQNNEREGGFREEVHSHIHTHITQSSQTHLEHPMLLRTEDIRQITETLTKNGRAGSRIETRTKITQSEELPQAKNGPLKRLRSLRNSFRKKISNGSLQSKDESSPSSGTRYSVLEERISDASTGARLKRESEDVTLKQRQISHIFEAIIDSQGHIDSKISKTQTNTQISGDRSKLHLDHLVTCHPEHLSLPTKDSFVLDFETDVQGNIQQKSDHPGTKERSWEKTQCEICHFGHLSPTVDIDGPGSPGYDCVDGLTGVDEEADGTFAEVSRSEQQRRVEDVARRLAAIADNYVYRVESDVESPLVEAISGFTSDDERLNSLEEEILKEFRKKGDQMTTQNSLPMMMLPVAVQLLKSENYPSFQHAVKSSLDSVVGWDQIAMYFYVTKMAAQLAGTGGALAVRMTDMAKRYFDEKFNKWIYDKGGWDSMLEETDSELD